MSAGLKKQKFFCELCKKQCADADGWKCHQSSESHKRMLQVFSEDPESFTQKYSDKFEDEFLELLKHLAQKEKIELDKDESGQQIIKYLEHRPEDIQKKLEEEKKRKLKLAKEAKERKEMEKQIELAKSVQEKAQEQVTEEAKEPEESNPLNQNLSFSMSLKKKQPPMPIKPSLSLNVFSFAKKSSDADDVPKDTVEPSGKTKPVMAMDLLMSEFKTTKSKQVKKEDEGKEKADDEEDAWIEEGIVVKVKDDQLKKYYNKKGFIKKCIDKYVAQVQMLDDAGVIQIDQAFLETVIPSVGSKVKVLKPGKYRGKIGILESIHQDNFSGSIHLPEEDVALEIKFELFSKLHV